VAGDDLFGRRWTVQLGTILIDALRVTFKVVRTSKRDPNTLELAIYNLAPTTRAQLSAPTVLPLILQAGYATTMQQIFSGDVRRDGVSHVREGSSWVTRIRCGDGERAYRAARVQTSFVRGTPITTILQTIAATTGLPIGNLLQKAGQGDVGGALSQAINGLVASGNSFDKLERIMGSMGYDLSVQDGQLQALAPVETTPEPAIVLSSFNGMIGSPETGANGVVKVKSLLQPGAHPGRPVSMQSLALQGPYRIEAVTHEGDSHGLPWYSELELKPL